ncbi:MAG: flagellin, partial [Phycisphaerales bacterium]
DDPAGLIASENLRASMNAIGAAIKNAQRAEQVVNVAEGALAEISNLIVELQSLVGASANEAGTSKEEKDANQLQIDSILQTIDRLANSTSFLGVKLLNGNFDYTTSGVTATLLTDVTINSARLATDATMTVAVTTLISAQTGGVFLSTGGTYNGAGEGALSIEVTGNDGVQQFTFASGTTQTSIITAINAFKDAIGVSAIANGGRVEMRSLDFGSNSFVRAKEIAGPDGTDYIFDAATGGTATDDLKDKGRDATVTINGIEATTDGLEARVSSDGFDVAVTIDGLSNMNKTNGSTSFTITGGGATFNLSPDVNLAGKVSLGIETVTTGNLGNKILGFLSDLKSGGTSNVVNGDLTAGQKIVDQAIKQVASLRGRLGAFQKNVVGSTIASLGATLENTAAAESAIRDADFAIETAELTRRQILSQAATQSLVIANAQPQSVLQLLG